MPLHRTTISLGTFTCRRNIPMVPYRTTAMMYFTRSVASLILIPSQYIPHAVSFPASSPCQHILYSISTPGVKKSIRKSFWQSQPSRPIERSLLHPQGLLSHKLRHRHPEAYNRQWSYGIHTWYDIIPQILAEYTHGYRDGKTWFYELLWNVSINLPWAI